MGTLGTALVGAYGVAKYTVYVINTDNSKCPATTFNIAVADSNGTNFTSGLSAASLSNLKPGRKGSVTLTVSAAAAAADGATNNSTVSVTAVAHTAPADKVAATTIGNRSALLHNSKILGSAKWGIPVK